MKQTLYILILVLFSSIPGYSQESPPTSYDPIPRYTTKKNTTTASKEKREDPKSKSKKTKKGSLNWQWDQQIVEYEKRKKANVKKYRKEARLASKPQYSDPSYFGHKRKPKKRKTGKRKLCKECKIVH